MFNIIVHTTALADLMKLSETLRTRMLMLIERLSVGAMSEDILRKGDVFTIHVGDNQSSRTLYAVLEQSNLYLLLLTASRGKWPDRLINDEVMYKRYDSAKLVPITSQALRDALLTSHEGIFHYKETILEDSLQLLIHKFTQRSGLTRDQIARKLNSSVDMVGRIEGNPLSVSLKSLVHYMAIVGAELEITLKSTKD